MAWLLCLRATATAAATGSSLNPHTAIVDTQRGGDHSLLHRESPRITANQCEVTLFDGMHAKLPRELSR
jgi:hypothetical protein